MQIEFDLPWVTKRADRKRFRRLLIAFVAVTLGLGGVLPLLPLPEPDRAELEELPPQLARIMLEKPEIKIPPPPPPPVVEKVEPKEVLPEPTPAPIPEPKPVPEVTKVEPPKPTATDAREKAKTSGLLQFADAFADMRDAVDLSKLQDTGSLQQGSGEAKSIDRSLLTSKRGTRSAGVNVAAMSSDTGGVALSGRETTRVEVPIDSKGGARQKTKVADAKAREIARERSIEEVRRVFDKNKGAIFAIYNRALRKNPGLQGKVVLELTIDSNGRVRNCSVVESEIADAAVVAKIVNRVKLFDFGARDVKVTRINYPIHFLPS